MENNINNSTSVNPAVSNGGVPTGNVNPTTTTVNNVVNPTMVSQPTVANQTTVNSIPVSPSMVNYGSSQAIVNQPTNTGGNNNTNVEQKSYKKFYTWMGIFVGLVLIIAGILLVFLLNGSIQNRNRLTCNKTTQESEYTYNVKRLYIFDEKIMQRVNLTYTFEYTNTLTDLQYNQDFDEVINSTYGSTKYGFATNIKKEGNVVTITAFQPSYWGESLDKIKQINKDEGYTCK